MNLTEIRKFLLKNADSQTKQNIKKFIPTQQRFYGVKTSFLNKIVRKNLFEFICWSRELTEKN